MEGYYCPGDGQAIPCPANSTTTTQRSAKSDCICKPGHFYVLQVQTDGSEISVCPPCARKSYKPNLGNGECPLNCPANADSELGASSLADCFCEIDYYASIDSNSQQLAKCISCTFEGLDCRGGFEKSSNASLQGIHALPISKFLVCTKPFARSHVLRALYAARLVDLAKAITSQLFHLFRVQPKLAQTPRQSRCRPAAIPVPRAVNCEQICKNSEKG